MKYTVYLIKGINNVFKTKQAAELGVQELKLKNTVIIKTRMEFCVNPFKIYKVSK